MAGTTSTARNGRAKASNNKLEQRVAVLERQVAAMREAQAPTAKDWRRTIGMFAGDDVMKQIDEEARKYREADRRKAATRRGSSRKLKARTAKG